MYGEALMQKVRRARVLGDAGFGANLRVERGR